MNQSKVKRLRKELREKMGISKEASTVVKYEDLNRHGWTYNEKGVQVPVRQVQTVLAEGQFKLKMKQAKRAWNSLSTPEKEGLVRSANVA